MEQSCLNRPNTKKARRKKEERKKKEQESAEAFQRTNNTKFNVHFILGSHASSEL